LGNSLTGCAVVSTGWFHEKKAGGKAWGIQLKAGFRVSWLACCWACDTLYETTLLAQQ
jgi:hypothetical protein